MLICLLIGVLFVVYNIISANAQPKALMIVEYGDVYYSYDNQNYLKVEVKEFDIRSGVYVKTGIGKAHIVLPNNSVLTVDEETNILLNYNPGSIDILQIIGNTWHRVKNLGGTGYNVKTPNAIAAVRGTEFSIRVKKVDDKIATQVVVTENQVDLSLAEPPQVAMSVMEGMVGEVKGENEFKVSKISKEMKESEWLKKNEELTETLKSTESEDKQKNSANVIKLKSEESEKQNKSTGDQQNLTVPTATPTPTLVPTTVPNANGGDSGNNFNEQQPTPVPTPLPGEVYVDQVV
ncbi:MAG TPA: FecR family protein, partial [Ignavibacteria bacterium]|nr:FecR family protein [Ignavibacteria bacterium]